MSGPMAPPSHPGEDRGPRHLAILGLYALLAIALTWPLAARFATRVPMGDNDLWQTCWNLWWWKTALCERFQCPYATDLLFYPEGAPLGLHTHSEANMLWTLPVNLLLGVPAALNLALLAGFIFAGFGAYLLALEYTPRRGAAFLAGVVFAFFPQHVEQSLEHLNLASIQGIPFFLWALVRAVRCGGRWWWAAGGFFALNALLSWHHALIAVSLGIPLALFEAWKGPRRPLAVLRDLAAAALLATAILSPFLWPILRDLRDGVADLQKGVVPKPIDPLFILIPHPGHPLWGKALGELYAGARGYPSVGFVSYLGVAALGLAAAAPLGARALARARAGEPQGAGSAGGAAGAIPRGGAWLWIALALFFLVLALGETLQAARQEFPSVPLPFRWLKEVPLFGLVRVPNRFLAPAALAVAVLAAIGGGAIVEFLPRRGRKPFVIAAAALLALDFLWIPYPMREVPRPGWIDLLDSLPAGLAVMDIPSGHHARAAEDMLLQTFHHRPIVNGYLSARLRRADGLVERFPVLRRVWQPHPPPEAFSGPGLIEAIRSLEAGIVVVHLDRTVERITEMREAIQAEHPGDYYRLRTENPEKGIPAALLEGFRAELRAAFGPPVRESPGEVEIYLVTPP